MPVRGKDGLVSERTAEGDIGLLIVEDVGTDDCRGALGVKVVARDISRTRSGRICFPSECV